MTPRTYTQTCEYCYDLMEHFYQIHKEQIELVGAENVMIFVPAELYELLACKKHSSDEIVYPKRFRKIDFYSYHGSAIIFALKETKRDPLQLEQSVMKYVEFKE